jgi:hypothetical protein
MSRPERVAEQRVLTEVSPSETTHTRLIAEKPKGIRLSLTTLSSNENQITLIIFQYYDTQRFHP